MDIIEKCDKCKLHECINCEHSWSDIEEIKQKLAEKDKLIEELQTQNKELLEGAKQMLCEGKEVMQSIRHLVCEEIKKELTEPADRLGYNYAEYMYDLEDLIDRIDWIEGEE